MSAAVDDPRIPRPSDLVVLEMPRRTADDRPTAALRVGAQDGLVLGLVGDIGRAVLDVGTPVVVTWADRRNRLVGTVIETPEGVSLGVLLDAPPEHRASVRCGVSLPARLELLDTPDAVLQPCTTVDLSEGGLSVCVAGNLARGAQAFVGVDLPSGEEIVAVVEILNCLYEPYEDRYVARLQFVHLSSVHEHRLRAYLAAQ